MKTIRLCSPAVQDESQVRSGYNIPALNTTNIQYEVALLLATSGGFYRLVSQ